MIIFPSSKVRLANYISLLSNSIPDLLLGSSNQ
nr:MAG TPA: hypothetical protein [Caudoviricetes sp.]